MTECNYAIYHFDMFKNSVTLQTCETHLSTYASENKGTTENVRIPNFIMRYMVSISFEPFVINFAANNFHYILILLLSY